MQREWMRGRGPVDGPILARGARTVEELAARLGKPAHAFSAGQAAHVIPEIRKRWEVNACTIRRAVV
jgi:hypothetical protein